MDQRLKDIYGSLNQLNLSEESLMASVNQILANGLKLDCSTSPSGNSIDFPGRNMHPNLDQEGDLSEDYDFSDEVLKYINEMLMEEDMEEKNCMFQESSVALQAAERSLYELIGEKYPPSNQNHGNTSELPLLGRIHNRSDGNHEFNSNCTTSNCCSGSSSSANQTWNCDLGAKIMDGFVESPVSTLRIEDIFSDSESVLQFKRGFEEASKFIPNDSGLFLKYVKEEATDSIGKVEKKDYWGDTSRGKKNRHPEDSKEDEQKLSKQTAVSNESNISSEMFDFVLLQCGSEYALLDALRNGQDKNFSQNSHSKGLDSVKSRGKKKGEKDMVDLRTLLTLCAQAVAADDRRSANAFLKQIRQHSSATGNGMHRLAHYFADGLEARLAGSGSDSYTAVMTKPVSAAAVLKAHHLHIAACPFIKLSYFFSNMMIMNRTERASSVHIIDFGILYGFQWPCFIRRLSSREGGPPKLRITGIDLPIPGFRPAARVEETGRRLANYAKTFGVPFEFNAIAQKWDSIQIEDLKIEKDEVLVVNCLYRFRNLLDETVTVESPRNKVLSLIHKVNPDVFIQGEVNGAYSAPFFITRFREALFHYSTLFDMLETTVPREIEERMLIEEAIFGREVMNVVACEGGQRIERPETYKQWQVRNIRAGFKQLPLNEKIKKVAMERVANHYHKDFLIDEDSQWLLQGWKGRILYALSSWVPVSR